MARQAPLSVGFSRQEYCSGWPLPSPYDPPDPGLEPRSPVSQADSLPKSYKEVHTPVTVIIKSWLYRRVTEADDKHSYQEGWGRRVDELEDWDSQFLKIITVFIVIMK